MRRPSVLVGMSGGVDSSVAACLLHEWGWRVIGSHLKMIDSEGVDHGCCGPTAEADAAAVADAVGFDFEVVDVTAAFARTVVADYLAEHRGGRTPNPCVRCNQHIKFGAFIERADALRFDFVATGHYARRWRDQAGAWHLSRGVDNTKDQSYMLWTLGQAELAKSLFPVGSQTKSVTRQQAERFGLAVAQKPDSQELCFAPGGDQASFLTRHAPDLVRPGSIVDVGGNQVGRHEGTFRFTVGQRRGTGVSTGERAYVLGIDPASDRIVVGPKELLARPILVADDASWVSGNPPARPVLALAQVRYRSRGAPALVTAEGSRVLVEFRTPQRGLAPGQSVVFYAGEELLGGARIADSAADALERTSAWHGEAIRKQPQTQQASGT